jgi:hypothetical protein
MVSGMFPFDDNPASVLFDSSATFSFIASSACTYWNLVVKDIEDVFEVETATSKSVTVNKVVDD